MTPAALAAAIFYFVAAGERLKSSRRGHNESVALWSDGFIARVLTFHLIGATTRGAF